MNWEDSRASTPLKRDFLRAWFAQEQRFFLTGGSALGLFYLDHRHSYDLDLFSDAEVPPKEIDNLVAKVSGEISCDLTKLRSSPDFHRFLLKRDNLQEIIDVVIDRAPQIDPEKPVINGIRVDSIREITANKLTTLLSRSELKDVIDLYFLDREGHDLIAAIPDAQAKDGGWEPATVSMILDHIEIFSLPDWMIQEVDLHELNQFLQRLRLSIAELAIPEQ